MRKRDVAQRVALRHSGAIQASSGSPYRIGMWCKAPLCGIGGRSGSYQNDRLIFSRFSDTLRAVMRTLIVIMTLLIVCDASAQLRLLQPRNLKKDSIVGEQQAHQNSRQVAIRTFLGQIEHGILNSTLTSTSAYFANQVLVNISGAENGYFSSNQVLSVLQNYFANRKLVSFEFSRFSDQGSAPYATGRYTFANRGNKESAQIYVALTQQDSRWVISQFNIY